MSRRKKFVHGKEVGLTVEHYSEDDTQFPAAWDEVMKMLLIHDKSKERIIGFRIKLHFAPVKKAPDLT